MQGEGVGSRFLQAGRDYGPAPLGLAKKARHHLAGGDEGHRGEDESLPLDDSLTGYPPLGDKAYHGHGRTAGASAETEKETSDANRSWGCKGGKRSAARGTVETKERAREDGRFRREQGGDPCDGEAVVVGPAPVVGKAGSRAWTHVNSTTQTQGKGQVNRPPPPLRLESITARRGREVHCLCPPPPPDLSRHPRLLGKPGGVTPVSGMVEPEPSPGREA